MQLLRKDLPGSAIPRKQDMRILNQEKEHDMDRENSEAGHAQSGSVQSDGDQPKETRYDVFLSYSHKDAELYGKDLIQSIKDEIEADLFDITCRRLVFLDSEALNYGDEWHAKIMEKLNECRVFICLLSDNYLNSTYCMRERLWWETREIRRGRLRQATLPVYFIRLNHDPNQDEKRRVRDLFGFQMESEPWFDRGGKEVKDFFLKERLDNLKNAVRNKLTREEAASGFNTVIPDPSKCFVGRVLELKELHEICLSGHIPIIEGVAGAGKTELATVYAYGYAGDYPQGRFLIHMEGKRSWEDAVLSLVKDPDTGRNVQAELGIMDSDMRKDGKSLHRLIIEKIFARAGKGRLLLLLDNVDDASLFRERELQGFSLKQLIPDNIHMIATTRHELEIPNERNRAKKFALGNLDDDESFELFCEIGRNRFPFSKKKELDENDPEYIAAMEIIHLVEGHVWSLEIIAGQIADKYDDGVTFQNRMASLRKRFSIEGKGHSWRSPADSPGDLVRDTLNILKKKENGEAIVRLAYFAALLAPDGKKKDVLLACWDKLFADVKFKNKGVDPFLFAYNHLWRYNLLHSKDDDKMHRLTQVGLKQIMKEDGFFDVCVEELADVMAEVLSIPNTIRIEAFAITPELMVCLSRKHPDLFSFLLSPGQWAKLLVADPSNSMLIELCPWNALSGNDWEKLLKIRPQFADRCDWDKLDGMNWAGLLGKRPQFADRCDWDKLDGMNWAGLLGKRPQFADRCDWDKLNGMNWADLLGKRPLFADRCDWNGLDGFNWAELLGKQPRFANRCKWESLLGFNWACLLLDQPQFADKCPWNELDDEDWVLLLRSRPQFADQCPWNELTGEDWGWILQKQPQFAEQCRWDKLSDGNKVHLLRGNPQFADKCDCDKIKEDWVWLLLEQPQFADKCPWDCLTKQDWAILISGQPRFADQCPWNDLDGWGWAFLLGVQPQFANRCNWNKLTARDWAELLGEQPRFADRCNRWNEMNGRDWAKILAREPQFADRCIWDKLVGEDWRHLLQKQPQFAGKCPFNELKR